jgi:hypothetical protein
MELLNPNETKLKDQQDLAEDSVVLVLDQGFNRDDAQDPSHSGDFIPVFIGSEFCDINGSQNFIPVLTVIRVEHLSASEIKAQVNAGGIKKEPFKVLETRRVRAFEFLSQWHPAAMTGDERAIKQWRSHFTEQIQTEKSIFENHRAQLRHVSVERNRTTENRLAEGIADFMQKFEAKTSKSTLP